MGDLASFLKGIGVIIALYCIAFFVFGSGFFNSDQEPSPIAQSSLLIPIDLGELASLEVIPDAALNENIYQTTGSLLNFSAATVTPSISKPKIANSNLTSTEATDNFENFNPNTTAINNKKATLIEQEAKKPIFKNTTKTTQTIEKPSTLKTTEKTQLTDNIAKTIAKDNQVTQDNPSNNDLPKYAFPVETFDLNQYEVDAGKIKKGQVIGKILNKHNVDHLQIVKLSKKSKKVHDVRDINYNKRYMVLTSKYADDVADFFIYEPDDYNYVVYDLTGETEVSEVKRTIEKRLAKASGEIKTSLYQTMKDNDLNPELAFQISEVYAWTVDFYRINSGDKFKVIYEEEFINGKSVGIGAIKAAWFEYEDNGYYSFQYEQDNLFDYYDTEGSSLRKQFLKAPLRYNRISSRFTRKRYHPVLKRNKSHLGTDYAAPTGTPIHSVGDGKVVEAKYGKYNGRYVKIRHNGIYSTQYLHMSKIEKDIKVGAEVKQGDVIGYVGSTGLASGPHLCFRFWKNGRQVDPFKQALPPSKPVGEANKSDYLTVVNQWKPLLDNMLINGEPIANNNAGGKENSLN